MTRVICFFVEGRDSTVKWHLTSNTAIFRLSRSTPGTPMGRSGTLARPLACKLLDLLGLAEKPKTGCPAVVRVTNVDYA
jgi:hypothetical protein